GIHIELTMLLIPGYNDNREESGSLLIKPLETSTLSILFS
ncbi:unnamed protein product, partial [marine sediment metagenome]